MVRVKFPEGAVRRTDQTAHGCPERRYADNTKVRTRSLCMPSEMMYSIHPQFSRGLSIPIPAKLFSMGYDNRKGNEQGRWSHWIVPGVFLFRGAIYSWMLLSPMVYAGIPYKADSIEFHDPLLIAHQHLTNKQSREKEGHWKGSKDDRHRIHRNRNLDTNLSHFSRPFDTSTANTVASSGTRVFSGRPRHPI
ncbi:uncharacterized protein BDW47DRAFT_104582 [Aspergillus candidus]|uniref:Uncharacterized protein n=1 Tax=Aspergillus candidus TaxID=41067 RepID=A0A2I2FDF2_ASPCN|nr:hypothetical protein BDW47DRAFT_104582 [Aspergillus candidus]PLB38624.1 hypothetical protein BDW47DRAFT_104582 [Aspergillus candidus]